MNNNILLSCKNQDTNKPVIELVQNGSNDIKIVAHGVYNNNHGNAGKRSAIYQYSLKSQKNARFSMRSFVDQEICLTLTYPLAFLPQLNGLIIKKNLNQFLTELRKMYKSLTYNWVLEFTKNGCPHFHLTTNIKPDNMFRFRKMVRSMWYRICGTQDPNHLTQGVSQCDYIKSRGGVANYISAYLQKGYQKTVPVEFENVGRFWATSRRGKVININQIDLPAAEDYSSCNTETRVETLKACLRPASKHKQKLHKRLNLQSKERAMIVYYRYLVAIRFCALCFSNLIQFIKFPQLRYKHYTTTRKAGNGIYWADGQQLLEKVTLQVEKVKERDKVPF